MECSWKHEYFASLAKLTCIPSSLTMQETRGFTLTLQETRSIHDSMKIPKSKAFLKKRIASNATGKGWA